MPTVVRTAEIRVLQHNMRDGWIIAASNWKSSRSQRSFAVKLCSKPQTR